MGRVTTLSRGGCTITNVRTAPPLYLKLVIDLPDAVSIELRAAIRWRDNETMGVEFLMLNPSDEQALTRFIHDQAHE
jgi:hypothetical protein